MKISKYPIICCFLVSGLLSAQNGEVVPLSSKVGLTIDAEENRYYNIFPDIGGFESAQVFNEGKDKYTIRIVWLNDGRRRTTRKQLTLRQFVALQTKIGLTPGKPGSEKSANTTSDTPVNTILLTDLFDGDHILIQPVQGWFYVGDVISTESNKLRVKTLWRERTIPAGDIASISVVNRDYQETRWRKIIYAGSGLIMIGITESGSRMGGISGDRLWYNRFLGLSIGLGIGLWINQWIQFWILPRHEYNIRS
ncbi:MAG: hypothetical protein GXO90_07850 [FCB group bacterium]|nr:hypothetical protein [FCB group bacterium]